ncbi:glycerophosphodiester phosphodiesterase [Roseococcus sp. DSY-14]|uniref:glycerophosphodiester phosphodiesterase n=1 Tax=Roseococcus sp. DSY-14 TaxID=3369650 RepID=UPI00387AB016
MTGGGARGDTAAMQLPELASHRGGAFLWPENSLLAFRHALAFEAEQVELDIHASRDGEPVVMHDGTLNRTTDATGPVAALDWEALRRVRVKGAGGEAMPHLREAARLILGGGKLLRLEVKRALNGVPYPGLMQAAAHAVPDRARTVIMSFSPAVVAEAAALGGWRETVLLVEDLVVPAMRAADLVAACRACGATELGVSIAVLREEVAQEVKAAGLRLSVWAANHAPSLRRALDPALALDAVATDDPPLAAALRAEAKRLRNA